MALQTFINLSQLVVWKHDLKPKSFIIMKFGKEFAGQMVPEWEEAYMKYNFLKSLLKDIDRFKRKAHKPSPPTAPTVIIPGTKSPIYRSFSGLTKSRRGSGRSRSPTREREEEHVILVKSMGNEGGYGTEYLIPSDHEGGEFETLFFNRLDEEFNKVVKFYQDKVELVLKEAASLNKQMDTFIAFKIRVHDPEGSINWSLEMNRLRSDIAFSAAAAAAAADDDIATSSSPRKNAVHHMDCIEESEQSHRGNSGAEDPDIEDTAPIKTSRNDTVVSVPMEILHRVKVNNTLEDPASTIKGVIKGRKSHDLSFKQKELKRIEEQLKQAFVEFYRKLRLLKNYSFLNLLAFSKIMKKYDKVTSRKASTTYLRMVEDSFLGKSDEVNRLIERVEATFIKHFANGNRSNGMKLLRPTPKKERHLITYSLGFFSGCMISLFVAIILIVRARNIMGKEGTAQYMETLFLLYSFYGFVVLHLILYGMNIYFWKRYRVNYAYILGFKHGNGLDYRQVFMFSVVLGTFALASVLTNLDMEMDDKTKDYKALTELLPLGLLTVLLLIIFCPFNILYRSSRIYLLRCLFHCLCAPLYKVTLPDFLLADQLTSQVQAMRNLAFYFCYYTRDDFKHRKNTCKNNDVFVTFSFLLGAFPFWIRGLQCVRRFVEEKDRWQGYNSLKYFSTVAAICLRTAYIRENSLRWKVSAWILSGISGVALTYWDIVLDWSLLQRKSKNPWLRDKLLVKHKSVYFIAIVVDILLRFAWVQTVLDFEVSFLHKEALTAVVATLEVIRRGSWNFFRLENEHLNNVEGYRAFKTVPLPFYYDEDNYKYE